jgi:hypothetical protein
LSSEHGTFWITIWIATDGRVKAEHEYIRFSNRKSRLEVETLLLVVLVRPPRGTPRRIYKAVRK